MTKRQRTFLTVGAILLTSILIIGALWLLFTRQAFPRTRGRVQVDGLTAPVEIIRDEYGVPHIYAETAEDLFFAQGYVHAQDRYWQMEFWRRIGAGRLSEWFGESTLGTDIYLRTVGFARVAEQEYAQATPEVKAYMDAYADGVNAYTQERSPADLGFEFALLQLQGVEMEIEPWTPNNTLTWAKVMSQDLGGNMNDELYTLDLIRTVGLELTADIHPSYRSDFPVIVPAEELDYVDGFAETYPFASPSSEVLNEIDTTLVGGFDPSAGLAFGKDVSVGSNNWTIHGDLTTTGMPLLANDPHLAIQMPSIWYEVGLHCVEKNDSCPFDMRGFSFAGVPGIISGHNDRIAWGVTNVGPDVQDLYIERINPANPDQYEVNGQWVDMDITYEEINIQREDEPYVLRVRSTRHGPVITDMSGFATHTNFGVEATPDLSSPSAETMNFTVLALQWTALQPNTTFESIIRLDRAQNWDDFREALRYFDAPSQNFVYADVDGNIGYQMPGLIPIRASGNGAVPMPGWTDDYEWEGFIPFDELPRAYNPEQDYIATANQLMADPDIYPYLIHTNYSHGYRAQRINELIETNRGNISPEVMASIQDDNKNLSAAEIVPYLEDLTFDDSAVADMRDRLLTWDHQMHMDSTEAAMYAHFWVRLMEGVFYDELPDQMHPTGGSRDKDAIFHLLSDPRNAWWDDIATPDIVETRDDILQEAFAIAYEDAIENMGSNPDRWRWGDVHTATFRNQTLGVSGIGPIEAIFNRGPVAASGGDAIINATSWDTTEPFAIDSLPSMRQIIDLGDLSNTQMIHPTGQSGHPYHRHYADFINPWRLLEYHPSNWTRQMVDASARGTLILSPDG